MLTRRDFLKRMAALGLLLPSTRTIIDMGANLHRLPKQLYPFGTIHGIGGTGDLFMYVSSSAPIKAGDFIQINGDFRARSIDNVVTDRWLGYATTPIKARDYGFVKVSGPVLALLGE